MKARNMLAILILILGSAASFYCYTRLNAILPMANPDAVTRAEAVVEQVRTPMVKKGQNVSDVVSEVRFHFAAQGQKIEGGYSIKGRDNAPKKGAREPVVYRNADPKIFLREAEYNDLPRQLKALRMMMVAFALAALVLPFAVMKHGA